MLKVADFNRQLKPQCVDSVQELIVVDNQVWAGLGNGDISVWDRKVLITSLSLWVDP
jgi:hypothetical protein